jgi:predicted nucleotide-binding protein
MPRGQSQRGQPTVSPETAIELLSEQIEKAKLLLSKQPIAENEYQRWDSTARNFVERAFGQSHPNFEEFEDLWSFGNYTWSRLEWSLHYAQGLRAKVSQLNAYIEQLTVDVRIREMGAAPEQPVQPEASNQVFIVHGHDGELKEATARLIEKLGLLPIILHEQANKGRTIIEKFSDHAQAVGFAVVLLSADDEGKSRESSDPAKLRARQNVVFELGFFFGSLGRGRVCAVYENGVDLPSDLQGVVYVPYDQGGRSWKYDVAKEIQAAGYEVNLNQI